MIIQRRRDGGLVFEVRWSQFVTDWKAASPAERVVLEDGRPAVRLAPDPEHAGHGEVTYTSLPGPVWEFIKARQEAAFAMAPPPPRVRLCQTCRAEMTVSREYENVWTFRCEVCKSVEAWGKDVVGGTQGAGEREKT